MSNLWRDKKGELRIIPVCKLDNLVVKDWLLVDTMKPIITLCIILVAFLSDNLLHNMKLLFDRGISASLISKAL